MEVRAENYANTADSKIGANMELTPPASQRSSASEEQDATAPSKPLRSSSSGGVFQVPAKPKPAPALRALSQRNSLAAALNDTPAPTAPGSPDM